MGILRSLRKKLNAEKVWVAQEVAARRKEIVKEFVEARVKEDAEFAQDVLNAVKEGLPENIKQAAEETLKNGPRQQVDNENPIVKKWENTGIFDRKETDPSLMIPIVESQAKKLLTDGTLAKLVDNAIKGKLQVSPNTKTNPGRFIET